MDLSVSSDMNSLKVFFKKIVADRLGTESAALAFHITTALAPVAVVMVLVLTLIPFSSFSLHLYFCAAQNWFVFSVRVLGVGGILSGRTRVGFPGFTHVS